MFTQTQRNILTYTISAFNAFLLLGAYNNYIFLSGYESSLISTGLIFLLRYIANSYSSLRAKNPTVFEWVLFIEAILLTTEIIFARKKFDVCIISHVGYNKCIHDSFVVLYLVCIFRLIDTIETIWISVTVVYVAISQYILSRIAPI